MLASRNGRSEREVTRSSHALDPLGAPRRCLERSTEDDRGLDHFPFTELDDRGAMPRTRVAGIGCCEEGRVHVAGSRNAEQGTDGRGDPSIFGAANGLHVCLHCASGEVRSDRPHVRSTPNPLAGLRPLRDGVRMKNPVLRFEIVLEDRADVLLNNFPIASVAHGALLDQKEPHTAMAIL